MKALLTIILATIFSLQITAATLYSTGNGNWESSSSWSTGTVPTDGDIIVIQVGHTISVSTNNGTLSSSTVDIIIEGHLYFSGSGKKLHLGCGSSIAVSGAGTISGGGGGGASNQITLCGSEIWRKGDGTAIAPFSHGAAVVLPIELLSQNAKRNEGVNTIEWVTASEINNAGFTILRSTDGISYETIGTVNSTGNSNTVTNYLLSEDISGYDTYYYKIIQFDMDGSVNELEPMIIHAKEDIEISVYPNPTSGYINVTCELAHISTISVYDINGKQVSTNESDLHTGKQIDVTNLIPGNYFIQIETENGDNILKQVVVNR